MTDFDCTIMSRSDQDRPPRYDESTGTSVRRHGDPYPWFSCKPPPPQHHLVGHVERLQVDVVIVLALEDVAVRRAARTDQHSAGEAHVHIVREQMCEIAHARIEAIAVGLLALD